MESGLSRCTCYALNEASHLVNEINIPVFQTNILILECQQQAMMVHGLYEVQGLAHTSPQGALEMDKH